ncbi:MAG: UDP-N-acetylmuramyl-tripeptide synthetase [Candidatus Vogelbacteria bacterium]|nr:UDP-N-acetylmuramyl-tripeptide synthetase [Candidatus Vogelbacteria bacterium]
MERLRSVYHYLWALGAAVWYRFPSRQIFVLGITGTKGKTTTLELIAAILETAGCRTAIASTLRFKIGNRSEPNRLKMTMPGRARLQKFLRAAVRARCDYALIEMTSEGAKQFRHRFIELNTLIFTNLTPEHIEAHGSYQNYLAAKLEIARQLERSAKPDKTIIANADDSTARRSLSIRVPNKLTYCARDAAPWSVSESGCRFTFRQTEINSPLAGRFNLYNLLAAATFAAGRGLEPATIKKAFEGFRGVRGRLERIEARTINPRRRDFSIIVDYAHTPESLKQVYEIFAKRQKICVLGAAGGGRDRWKRPVMGKIASGYCRYIILTNEDPYNEDPEAIVRDLARGIGNTPHQVIIDRRQAIRRALSEAGTGEIVIITGKGTDPYIMGPRGTRTPWDDATVVREELLVK